MKVSIITGVVFTILVVNAVARPGSVVRTQSGFVQGLHGYSIAGRHYEAFLGIPFAKPPLGNLRWEKPVPPEPWKDVLQATEYGAHCTQFVATFYPFIGMSGEDSEDCLYLNVFVPDGVIWAKKLPVMVFYYGGAFTLGTAAMYPMEELATHGDVIAVSINYRVSSLGWLSTGDKVAPGNYGLWDAKAALQWVQDNIHYFSGDPDSVTVFGQSAGSALTSHTLISPQMRGLRHRGIAISGGSTNFFGIGHNVRESTKVLSRMFLCGALDNSQRMVDCLREKKAGLLDIFSFLGPIIFFRQLPNFVPVVDGDMVLEPRARFEDGGASDCDFITGRAKNDFAGFIFLQVLGRPRPRNDDIAFTMTNETLNAALKLILNMYQDPDGARDAIWRQYPEWNTESSEERAFVGDEITTPWVFGASSHLEAELHYQTSPAYKNTYHYIFDYRQTFLTGYREWIKTSHVDDLYSVLGEPFMARFRQRYLHTDFKEMDRVTSRNVMSYYTNFAHSGNPNDGPNAVPEFWPPYTDSERQYMLMGIQPTVYPESQDQLDRYNFWNEEFTNYTVPRGEGEGIYNIDELSDEEFETILVQGVKEIQDVVGVILADYPEAKVLMRKKIDNAMAERQQMIEDMNNQ